MERLLEELGVNRFIVFIGHSVLNGRFREGA